MKTKTRHGRRSAKAVGLKAVEVAEGEDAVFEAIVSVFDNVDFQGDRVKSVAFDRTLAEWKASGDPIPVVFSHLWNDPDAHVGETLDAKAVLPGDPMLEGTGLEENGGLWVKFALFTSDPDEAAARRLAKRLTKRTIREFSFAYDVVDEEKASDGVNDLLDLDLLEIGPTLKGANPATRLLSKAFGDEWEDLGADEVIERLAKAVAEHRTGEKASAPVTFDGSIESSIGEFQDAAKEWATDLDVGNGGLYYLHHEATFPDELRAVVLAEGWEDPIGEGIFYELTFARDDEGTLSVEEAHELEISVEVSRKSRDRIRSAWSAIAAKARATVSGDGQPGKGDGNGEDPEDPSSRTGADGTLAGAIPASTAVELALMGAGLAPTDPDED